MYTLILICLILVFLVESSYADQSILERSPVKTIYLIQFAHLDIGFTDTQKAVAKRSAETIDEAVRLCDVDPDYKWTIESLWQLEQWMKGKSAKDINHLMSLVKSGRMSLTACHSGVLSSLMSPEESCRHMYPAERLRRDYGVSVETAIQDDIPGYSSSYPQVLKSIGVKYFAAGINTFIGAGARIPVKDNPFYWEGPDGSRVLTCICSDPEADHGGYILARWGYGWTKGGRAEQTVPEYLTRLEKAGYPYDAVLVLGGTGDNERTDLDLVEGVREWNEKHSTPKMVISTPEEYFRHMERKYGAKLPVFRGDWSGLWDQNAVGLPYGMGLNRQTKTMLVTGEAIAAFNDAFEFKAAPVKQIGALWEDCITYDEHSGGGVWPDMFTPEQAFEEAKTKVETAERAHTGAEELLQDALTSAAGNIQMKDDGILVWNTDAESRNGIVRVKIGSEWFTRSFNLVDSATGKPICYQKVKDSGEIVFRTGDVPGLGYNSYLLKRTANTSKFEQSVRVGDRFLENDLVRLELDGDGNVVSLLDKKNKRQLVDDKSRYKFGQLVESSLRGDKGCEVVSTGGCSISIGLNGPVAASLVVTRKASPLAVTEITVFADSPEIQFRHVFERSRTPHIPVGQRESYAVAYPLDLPDSHLVFDTAAGHFDTAKDWMPGASTDVLVQAGGDISNKDCGVAFSSVQSFRWEFEHPHGVWGGKIPPETSELMMRLLDKHDMAKYKGGEGEYNNEPGRPDILVFENSLFPHTGGWPSAEKFLRSKEAPLSAVFAAENAGGKLPDKGEMIQAIGSGFDLLCFKKAETGDGYVLRVMETDGKTSGLKIKSGLLKIKKAEMTDIVERKVSDIQVKAGTVEVSLKPRQIVTVKLHIAKGQ